MRFRKWASKAVFILLALAFLPGFAKIQNYIGDDRIANNLTEPFRLIGLKDLPLQQITGTLFTGVLSGFRGVVVDILWMKMDTAWDEGRDDLVIPLLNAVTMLDPRFRDAWEMLAWHNSFNLYAKNINKYGQWDWAARFGPARDGVQALEKGVRWNPTRAQLYEYMGTVYFMKMGDLEKAAEWLEKAYECPDHSNMAARNLAHIYESLPDFDKALYWYYVAAEDDPTHPTPPGAVMTIRERYLPAWRAYTNGDLELAKKLIENTLEDYQPAGRIALHFLTTILEAQARQAEAQGKRSEAEKIYKEAINKWEFCFALDKMDSMALRKAYELREKMGIPQPSDKELEDKWWSVETSFR